MPKLPPIRIVFAGNHNVGHDALRLLLDAGVNVVGVLAQPDSAAPNAQGHRSVPALARHADIATYQPRTFKDEAAARMVVDLAPDLLISVNYGRILPRAVLDVPRFGCVNLHGALLPDYRGVFPSVWAVMHGARQSGATLHVMDEGADSGDIIAQTAFDISEEDTGYSVHARTCAHSLGLLARSLPALLTGDYPRWPQPYVGQHYASLTDEDRCIRWDRPTRNVLRQIRACYFPPCPCSHTCYRGARYPVWRASSADVAPTRTPGVVLGFDGADRPIVATKDGAVILNESELIRPHLAVGSLLSDSPGTEILRQRNAA